MEDTLGRTCLILALLGVLLAVAFTVSPGARPTGTVAAQAVALEGGASVDDDVSEDEQKAERREAERPQRSIKQTIALLVAGYIQPPTSKNFDASDDVSTMKPRE